VSDATGARGSGHTPANAPEASAPSALSGNPAARLWLFDFDNTVAALERVVDWAASRRELETFLRREGVGDQIFREFPSRNLPLYNALLRQLQENTGMLSNAARALIRRASTIIESHELRGVDRAAPLPGAIELIEDLHAQRRELAIVTSNSSRTVIRWLETHNLLTQVNLIVGRDSLLPLKPAPAAVNRALEQCAIAPADAILVGDSEADAGAARAAAAGFYGIAASSEARRRLVALGAREVFDSPRELARHLALAGPVPAGC
jgi:HAD superfamily hydrolase (TIGR01509 family)